MEKAKAAVSEFLHKSGHHDTTVHENVAPAVVHENINKTRHDEATTIVDREVHQHHHHTTVQPINDREILPEQHHHHMGGVEHREHHHGNDEAIKARLEREAAQFKNTRTEGDIRETNSVAPTIGGEHRHHHVHETIQPVIQKEIIAPSVIHTTVPIHEVHHNEAKHHAASALPAITMAEFKKSGGVLNGREEIMDHFEGEPKGISNHLGNSSGLGERQSRTEMTDFNTQQNTPVSNGSAGSKLDSRLDSNIDGSRNIGGSNMSSGFIGQRPIEMRT